MARRRLDTRRELPEWRVPLAMALWEDVNGSCCWRMDEEIHVPEVLASAVGRRALDFEPLG